MHTETSHTGHYVALAWLAMLVCLAVFRDALANGTPLACTVEGSICFPGLSRPGDRAYQPGTDEPRAPVDWKACATCKACLYAPIPWSPGEWRADTGSARLPPLAAHPGLKRPFYHLLGTDAQGRDVAASTVAGARTAVVTGSIAAGLSLLLGIALGAIAGFWGDHRLTLTLGSALAALLLGLLSWYILAHNGIYIFFALPLLMLPWVSRLFQRVPALRKRVAIPADMLIMRMAEILDAIPRMVLIIAVLAIIQVQSTWIMVGLIGLLGWTGVAPMLRAELLRIRALPYIEAAQGAGLSHWRLLWVHALPNAIQVVLVTASMSMSAAILLEASLMFLGYGGLQGSAHSWGGMLSAARQYPSDWWVALFPGAMIACTVMSLYKLRNFNKPRK
jgi:peptide/nickel transport system permease protein